MTWAHVLRAIGPGRRSKTCAEFESPTSSDLISLVVLVNTTAASHNSSGLSLVSGVSVVPAVAPVPLASVPLDDP